MRRSIVRRSIPRHQSWGADLPSLLWRIYAARGVSSDAELDYGLSRLHHPGTLLGVEDAAELVADAVARRQRILIVGDFDADGATSTAVAMLGLQALGAGELDFRVPSRFSDGYGLTAGIVDRLQEEGALPDLLLTVDNGISAHEGVAAARQAGCQVVVTDHHLAPDSLPEAHAIVNPNQPGCRFPCKHAAGVGVVFYLLSSVRSELTRRRHFTGDAPSLGFLLDLVALGTVADVVPLDHNNRILVEQGLRRIRAGYTRPGIRALLELSGREAETLQAADLGFALGPRLNAAGRLDDMSLGIACLLSDDEARAFELATELDQLNRQRRSIESGMKEQAESALQALGLSEEGVPHGICLFDESWHQGVIGILASRIKEQFHRPVVAFARDDDGGLKGSARSITGVHIRDCLAELDARHPGLISRYGGHAMAAGLSLEESAYGRFAELFGALVRERADEGLFSPEIETDGPLAPEEMGLETARLLSRAGPWGQQFPEPCFDDEFHLLQQRIVGERHLKMQLMLPGTSTPVDAIAFNVDTGQWPCQCSRVHAVYQLDINRFRGRESVQLKVNYLEPL